MKRFICLLLASLLALSTLSFAAKPTEAATHYTRIYKGNWFYLDRYNMPEEDAWKLADSFFKDHPSCDWLIYAIDYDYSLSTGEMYYYALPNPDYSNTVFSVSLDYTFDHFSEIWVIGGRSEIIDEVTVSSNVASVVGYNKKVAVPTFKVSGTKYVTLLTDGNFEWEKQTGADSWEPYTKNTFEEGTYRYLTAILIMGRDAVLQTAFGLILDQTYYYTDGTRYCLVPNETDCYSLAWFYSDPIAVTKADTLYKIKTENCSVTVDGKKVDAAVKGTKITVTADDAPEGKVFDKWTISGAKVKDANAATTTFTMDYADVTIKAVYKDAPKEESKAPESATEPEASKDPGSAESKNEPAQESNQVIEPEPDDYDQSARLLFLGLMAIIALLGTALIALIIVAIVKAAKRKKQ